MRLLTLAALAITVAIPAHAAILQDQFDFGTDLTADVGTSLASSAGGSVSGGRYNFDANQGLTVALSNTLSTWSLVFSAQISDINGWRKLLDLSNLTSDNGLYNYSGDYCYYSTPCSGGTPIAANTDYTFALTYNGAHTVGYLNGVAMFGFPTSGAGYPSSLSSFIMFEDDFATGQHEAGSGSLDYLRVYNGALTGGEVGAISGVPLPATAPILLSGIGAFAALRRRKKA